MENNEVAKALKILLIDHHFPPDEQSLWLNEDLVVTREGRQVVDVHPPKSSKFQATESNENTFHMYLPPEQQTLWLNQ